MPDQIPMSSAQAQSFPTEVISLPSDGYFYPSTSPLAAGKIDLKFMTAKEEDILLSQNLIKKGVVLDKLLEALIVTPNVNYGDLLTADKNAILVAARRLAYGDKYETKFSCPKCEKEAKITVDLSTMKNKDIDFSKYVKGENKFSFTMPICKKDVVFKLLTHKDETDIDLELKALEKLGTGMSPEWTTRLKYMIISVGGSSDRATIKNFVDNLPSRDSMAFRKYLKETMPEIDTNFEYKCPHCDHTERMAMPMSADFFWPQS